MKQKKKDNYFLTIYTYKKRQYFGKICKSKMIRNNAGNQLDKELYLLNTKRFYHLISIEELIIMPNHIHLILSLNTIGKNRITDYWRLTQIINKIKRITKRKIKEVNPNFKWKRGFLMTTIKTEESLKNHKIFIRQNPKNWNDG